MLQPLVWARQSPNGAEHPAYELDRSANQQDHDDPTRVCIMWESNGEMEHLPREFIRRELVSRRTRGNASSTRMGAAGETAVSSEARAKKRGASKIDSSAATVGIGDNMNGADGAITENSSLLVAESRAKRRRKLSSSRRRQYLREQSEKLECKATSHIKSDHCSTDDNLMSKVREASYIRSVL